MKINENPFAFGKVVKGKEFFNRKKEREEIAEAISNGQNLILFSPRRYGKTSLILNVFDDYAKQNKNFAYFFIDFYKINSISDFISVMTNEYARNAKLSLSGILNSLKTLISGVTPAITTDDFGKPKIELKITPNSYVPAFEDVMKLPEKLLANGKKVAVFFDEFQESSLLKEFSFHKKLRAIIQHQREISYIFCGSKQHLFQEIFSDPNNPLFKIGETKYLTTIPEEEYVKYIHSKFKKIREDFTREHAKTVYARSGGIPYNVQFFAHHLYNLAVTNVNVPFETLIEKTVEIILANKNEEFILLYDSLSPSMRKSLEIVLKRNGKRIFWRDVVAEFNVASSTLNKAVRTLAAKGILINDGGTYKFQDVFFELWLKRQIG